ncbi:MAG: HNH endonuclease [Solirubrobacterales bacterium]
MSAFRRICLDCRRAFRPQGASTSRCRACQSRIDHRQLRRRQATGARTGSTRTWRKTRAQILAGRPLCACGAVATTVDHVIPVSKGGNDAPSNLRPMCAACNGRKGAR